MVFLSYFFLWTRGFSPQIWEPQRSAKIYHNSPEKHPSLHTVLPPSRVSWREPESIWISAVELEPVMGNKHRVHVPQGNHSLQVVDGFGLQEEQTLKLWSCLILEHPRTMIRDQKQSLWWMPLVTAAEPEASTELTWTQIFQLFRPRIRFYFWNSLF